MLSKLKTYAIAILGALAAFAGFMWQMTIAKHEKALKRGIKDAREVENKDAKATQEGLQNEAKVINNDIDADHFS